ncbi:DUF418 domain-containing protein [Metabacillus iocasae]|nr:DUF418 domain-containing protein [Metabacillus iocasae]
MKNKELRSIQIEDRIEIVDIVRGVALLGILFVNMPSFYSPDIYYSDQSIAKTSLDRYLNIVIDLVGQGSFYPLFAILFGFGFMVMFEQAYRKDTPFTPSFSRRLVGLFVIGVLHAFFIWYGDVLILYALCGLLLLIFQEARSQVLLTWATILWVIPTLIMSVLLLVATFHNQESAVVGLNQQLIEQSYAVYGNGTFMDILSQRAMDWYYIHNMSTIPFLVLSIFPMFLLGAYMAKEKWFHYSEDRIVLLKWITLLSFLTFLLFKVMPYIFGRNLFTDYVQDNIGGPAGTLFYLGSLLLISKSPFIQTLLKPFVAVGRLSLSNYLVQSLICTFIFYNYGLGLYGKITAAQGIMIAIMIFFVQMLISNMWIKFYSHGPIERVLRSITYWKKR